MWDKRYNNDPLPCSFQGYNSSSWGFTLFLRVCFCNHPTDATPTIESWSKSSRRDKLVLWSQEYFRLMESWRFLKNDSRSRASLKNCGDRRKGCLVFITSQHQDLNWERIILLYRVEQSWLDAPESDRSLQRPGKCKPEALYCLGLGTAMASTKPAEPHGKASLLHPLRNHCSFLLASD